MTRPSIRTLGGQPWPGRRKNPGAGFWIRLGLNPDLFFGYIRLPARKIRSMFWHAQPTCR